MVEEVISSLPGPVFQKVFLRDLPPELLLRIFDVCYIDDCRSLGLTCHAFHKLSLTYVYLVSVFLETQIRILTGSVDQTRRFILRVDRDLIYKRSSELSETDCRYLCQIKSTMRSRLLADFQFLRSRPSILERVQHMQVQNMWTGDLQIAAGIQPYKVPAVDQFFSPIYSQIVATLSMATHL